MFYFLQNGRIRVTVKTSDPELNEALAIGLPTVIEGGIWTLNLLAYVLSKMDAKCLGLFREHLPAACAEISELLHQSVSLWHCHLLKDGNPRKSPLKMERFDTAAICKKIDEELLTKFSRALDMLRLTGGQLFANIMKRAKENGDLERFGKIEDYLWPDRNSNRKITNYAFDLVPAITFGTNEGIILECSIRGNFDNSEDKIQRIGFAKTLGDSMEDSRIMGELCGILLYHGTRYINDNLFLFESSYGIERLLKRPLNIEPSK